MADPGLRTIIVDHLRATRSHLLVDEIFDANEVDLTFIELHCEAGVPVTVVGDYWQALYEFRQATPKHVRDRLKALGFVKFSVLRSYRFDSSETQAIAGAARGQQVILPTTRAPVVNVVLARFWGQLWEGPAWILPTR